MIDELHDEDEGRLKNNVELAYSVSHIYKHSVGGLLGLQASKSNQPAIHQETMQFLWDQRAHSHYLERPTEAKRSLAEILDMPEDPMNEHLLFTHRNHQFNFYECDGLVKKELPLLEIPHATTFIRPSLLTDAIRQSTEELRTDTVMNELAAVAAEKKCISQIEAWRHLVANASYHLFIAGHFLPHIQEGTKAYDKMLEILDAIRESREIVGYRERLQALLSK